MSTNEQQHPYLYNHTPLSGDSFLIEFALDSIPGVDLEPLTLRKNAKTATLPNWTTDAIEVPWSKVTAKFAGRSNIDNISISFFTGYDEDLDALRTLQLWHSKAVFNPATEQTGFKSDYAVDMTAWLLDLKGAKTDFVWYYYGVMPLSGPPIELDRANAEPLDISIDFSTDKMVPGFGDFEDGAAPSADGE